MKISNKKLKQCFNKLHFLTQSTSTTKSSHQSIPLLQTNKKSILYFLYQKCRSSVKNSFRSQFSAASQSDQNYNMIRDNSIDSSHQNYHKNRNRSLSRKPSFDDHQHTLLDQQYKSDNQFQLNGNKFKQAKFGIDFQIQYEDINTNFLKSFKKSHQYFNSQNKTEYEKQLSQIRNKKDFPYKSFYLNLQQCSRKCSMEEVHLKYPKFALLKPDYKLKKQQYIKECYKALIDGSVMVQKDFKITVIDVKSLKHETKDIFYIAAGTTHNVVFIFQLRPQVPVKIIKMIEVFKQHKQQNQQLSIIRSVQWSESMKYLAVSNKNKQFKVLQLKSSSNLNYSQPSLSNSLVLFNTLQQLFTLESPRIKASVHQCYFLHQHQFEISMPPYILKMLVIDQQYQIYMVELKKHFISYKPNITRLPVKFNEFSEVKLKKFRDIQNEKQGIIMVVGGIDFVTIAIIEPKFEILLVYDKQKHFPNAKKNCFPNVSFLNEGNNKQKILFSSYELMICWDKYMEILQLTIQSFQPLTYKIHTKVRYTFPDSSISLGFISQSIIYQLTRLQVKLYSIVQLLKYNNNCSIANNSQTQFMSISFAQPITTSKIQFSQFLEGELLEDQLSNSNVSLQALNLIKNLVKVNHHKLFIIYSKNSVYYQLSIQSFSQFVETVIQNTNDWKHGLQLFYGVMKRQITVFDNLRNESKIIKQLRQYSSRYVEFLKSVIPLQNQIVQNEISDKTNNLKIEQWKQEIYFLGNILIGSNQQIFFMKQILIKIYRISPQLLKSYEPFILLHYISKIEIQTFDLLLSIIDRQIGNRLVFSIKNSLDQLDDNTINNKDNEIAHLINNILIRYQMYFQMIWINQHFGDFYTPFVILISKYQQKYNMKEKQFRQKVQTQLMNQRKKIIKQITQENENIVEKQQIYFEQQNFESIAQRKTQSFRRQKLNLSRLISFLTFDTFHLINASQYSRHQHSQEASHHKLSKINAKYLLETLIPLMNLKLNYILIENCAIEFFNYIMEQLFKGNCLEILNQLDITEFEIKVQKEKENLHYLNQNQTDLMTSIIHNIRFRHVIQNQCQANYWLLIVRLMMRKLIKQIQIIPGLYFLILQYEPNSKNEQLSIIKLLDQFVKQCSKQLEIQFYSMEQEKKCDLFDKIKQKHYMELLKLMGRQLNRQIEVLECLVKYQPAHTIQLIQYVSYLLKTVTEQKHSNQQFQSDKAVQQNNQKLKLSTLSLSSIKSLLKNHIKLFTSIDPQKISTVLIDYYKSQMKLFIKDLNQNPKEQLNLLKQILIHYNYGQELNNQKIKYLQLLARMGKQIVILEEVKYHMFPLDQSIQICKKYQILDPWAYLLRKSGGQGNAELAIQIYFRLIKQHIQNYKYNRKTQENYLELKQSLNEQLQKCIQICIELDRKGSLHYQTEWFFVIEELQLLKEFVYRTCSPQVEDSLKRIINDFLYPMLIQQLLDEVSHQNLVAYLIKSLSSLDHQTVQFLIIQMVKGYFYEKQILKNAYKQLSRAEILIRSNVFQQVFKGFITSSRCYQCMKKDVQMKMHYYSCGHDIHTVCNQDVKECISCKNDLETMIYKQINMREKIERMISYNISIEQKTQKQLMIKSRQQKMLYFDQMLQNYSIVNLLKMDD